MTLTGITPLSSELIFHPGNIWWLLRMVLDRYLTTRRIVLTGQASAQAFLQSIEHWFFSLPLPIRMLVQFRCIRSVVRRISDRSRCDFVVRDAGMITR